MFQLVLSKKYWINILDYTGLFDIYIYIYHPRWIQNGGFLRRVPQIIQVSKPWLSISTHGDLGFPNVKNPPKLAMTHSQKGKHQPTLQSWLTASELCLTSFWIVSGNILVWSFHETWRYGMFDDILHICKPVIPDGYQYISTPCSFQRFHVSEGRRQLMALLVCWTCSKGSWAKGVGTMLCLWPTLCKSSKLESLDSGLV